MRLRTTAPPILRVIVKPKRAPSTRTGASGTGTGRRRPSMMKIGVTQRAPPRTRLNSAGRLSVWIFMCRRLAGASPRPPRPPQSCLWHPRHSTRGTATPDGPVLARSGREALATLGPAPREHAHAADRRHPLPETVAAFANEPARLVSPLHVSISVVIPVLRRLAPNRDRIVVSAGRADRAHALPAATASPTAVPTTKARTAARRTWSGTPTRHGDRRRAVTGSPAYRCHERARQRWRGCCRPAGATAHAPITAAHISGRPFKCG